MANDNGKKRKMRKDWKKILVLAEVLIVAILLIQKLKPELLSSLYQEPIQEQTVEQVTISDTTTHSDVTGTLQLHMIDVGQADSILIIQGEECMLVDCGTSGSGDEVAEYLKQNGVSYIDVLVGTHPHDDHMGGMWKVIRAFYNQQEEKSNIGTLYAPDNSQDNITTQWYERFLEAVLETNVNWVYPKVGDVFYVGQAKVQILGPTQEKHSNLNNYSIALRVSFGEIDIMLTGDAEELAELEIIETGLELESEVMKAGHHGSDTSNSDEFLDAVNPQYFLVSAGLGNQHEHPIESVMDRIEEREITVYRTDESGTVIMQTDGKNIEFNTEPGSYLSGEELERKAEK